MSVDVIRATVSCDGCGQSFKVDLDPARRAWARRQSIMDFAEDALSGGTASDGGFCSFQADLHLCEACTMVVDAIGPDDHTPTAEEIAEALEERG